MRNSLWLLIVTLVALPSAARADLSVSAYGALNFSNNTNSPSLPNNESESIGPEGGTPTCQ